MSLERGSELLSQSFRLIAGNGLTREPAARLGLSARLRRLEGARAQLSVQSNRLIQGVRVSIPGFEPSDDAFSIEPGHSREVALTAVGEAPERLTGSLTALNLAGRVVVTEEEPT
jgi:hypothetical protein